MSTFAVQIAKSFGAEVTGVCSSKNVDMVRSIGADHVIDYTQEEFTESWQRYDLMFDCIANHSLSACTSMLNPEGTCVMVGDFSGRGIIGMLARLTRALVLSRLGNRKLVTFLTKPNKTDLYVIQDLMKAGKIESVVDKRYGLNEVPDAIRHLEEKHTRGKLVIILVDTKRI